MSASLLDRIQGGPVRTKNASNSRSSTPYNRPNRVPKGDINSDWKHDMYDQSNTLSARMNLNPAAPRATFTAIAQKALKEAAGQTEQFSIKGAGSPQTVVDVTGLVAGTTAEDVAAIFKQCGTIIDKKLIPGPEVKVRVTFSTPQQALSAVNKFDGKPADGKTLSVKPLGGKPGLGGRLGGPDGLGIVRQEGSVDVLMNSAEDTGSKMRSDSLLGTAGAQVLLAPPGADPKDYTQSRGGDSWRGRGGRGRGGRRGRGGKRMDVD